jgi:hypothetical protein
MTQPTEVLLTEFELAEITLAATDPLLKDPQIVNIFGRGATAVHKVSPKNELILIRGNEHTGLAHISARHSYFSRKPTWLVDKTPQGEQKHRLDDPGRFRPASIPVIDYLAIADAIYSVENLATAKNKRPDVFDIYVGDFTYPDGVVEKHTLILYKGTKIIHTLFPQERTNNRARLKGFPFTRGLPSYSWHVAVGILEVNIPYLNHANQVKYSIVIKIDSGSKVQETLLWAHNERGEQEQYILLDSRPHSGIIDHISGFEMVRLQYADLRWCEQAIKDTESGKIQRLPPI